MKKLLALLVMGGVLGLTTGCPGPTTATKKTTTEIKSSVPGGPGKTTPPGGPGKSDNMKKEQETKEHKTGSGTDKKDTKTTEENKATGEKKETETKEKKDKDKK